MDILRYNSIIIKACIYWILVESRFIALIGAFHVYQTTEENYHEGERSADPASVRPSKYPKKQSYGMRMTNFSEGFAKTINISVDYDDNIEMQCNLLISPDHIIWERTHLLYPLAVGRHLFSPDTRLQLRSPAHARGNILIIANATAADEGEYRCRSAVSSRKTQSCKDCKPTEIVFRVFVGSKNPKGVQVDEPQKERLLKGSTVRIIGPKLAFYGLPLELKCIANFTSPEAKMDPGNVLEWYHNGIRIRNGRHHIGRALITRRWIDSYLLESRLILTWVSEREGGMWFCVNRGQQVRSTAETTECNSSQAIDGPTTAPPVNSSTRTLSSSSHFETGSAEISYDQLFIRIMAPPSIIGIQTHSRFPDTASANNSLLDPVLCKKNPNCQWLQAAASRRRRPADGTFRPISHPSLLPISLFLLVFLFT
nr:unnamed protein product [Spirometra erinaceieuropaei]